MRKDVRVIAVPKVFEKKAAQLARGMGVTNIVFMGYGGPFTADDWHGFEGWIKFQLSCLPETGQAISTQRTVEPYLFRMMALVLPRRLWEEELGDALEVLHALRKSGAPPWQIQVKIFSTFAWSLVNALREVMSAVTGQAREKEK